MIDNTQSFTSTPHKSRALAWAFAIVIGCGVLLAYYILKTYFQPRDRQYQLDFGKAQWIEPADPGPTAYFRTKVFLSSPAEQAWIEVAAMDNFRASVNGHSVGVEGSVKIRMAGIYDMKKRLKPGTNVIGVSTARTSFPGAAQILVRGYIKERGGKVTEFLSDGSWRVTTNTGIVGGSEAWTSSEVDDEKWPHPVISAANDSPVSIAWVDLNPLVLQLESTGSWLASPRAASEATFTGSFQASQTHQETWLEIASSGDLNFMVNGHLITSSTPTTSRLPHLSEEEMKPEKSETVFKPGAEAQGRTPKTDEQAYVQKATLTSFDISYWVRKGENKIVATVRADHAPANLLATGFVVDNDGTVHRFQSDESWKARDIWSNRSKPDEPAVLAGVNGTAPWDYLPQVAARSVERTTFFSFLKSLGIFVGTVLGVLALWLIVSGLVAKAKDEPYRASLVRDALFHTPIIAGLALLLLPNYDTRFPADWSFCTSFIIVAVILLLAVRLFHLFPAGDFRFRNTFEFARFNSTTAPYYILIAIVALGFSLRAYNNTFVSFDHDEMGLVQKSKGIYSLGFPFTRLAGEVRWITTYEAVPYPLAFAGLFGYSEFTMRMPSLIFGTLSIGVVALLGRRLFNWRTGLIAALLYACIPLNIRWAQNCFYPSQCQFLALLTIWVFYEGIREKPLKLGYLTAWAILYPITYLSWEGTAFLLIAMCIALIVYHWNDWFWLKEIHFYKCTFIIVAVVVAQYCSRTIAGDTYLQVGSGANNLAGPSLFFLTPAYQPLYYVDHLWLSENHVIFTILCFLALPVCWGSRSFRYLFTILVGCWFFHTNFLAALSPRYCYYYQVLLVICGVAAGVMLYDRLLALARRESDSAVAWVCAHACGIGIIALLFLSSNDWLMQEYKLSSLGNTPGLMNRYNTYKYDYRGVDLYVKNHLQSGDVVLPGIPHVYHFYTGHSGNYTLDTLLSSKVAYNQTLNEPRFVDKFDGLPVVRNLSELKEIANHANRTWVIFAPYASFEKLNTPDVLDYLNTNARTVYESYRAKVFLLEGQAKSEEEKTGTRTAQM